MTTNDNNTVFVFNPDKGSHFDLCQYCRNCSECIDKHWKTCRPWIDRKALKEQRPISYR